MSHLVSSPQSTAAIAPLSVGNSPRGGQHLQEWLHDPLSVVTCPLNRKASSFFAYVTRNNLRSEFDHAVAGRTVAAVRKVFTAELLARLRREARFLDDDSATSLLGILGFLVASIGRQSARHGGTPNFAVEKIPELEMALLALSDRTGHPPRDSAETAWLNNPPYSFTGRPGEQRFADGVRMGNALLSTATEHLRSVRSGQTALANAVTDLEAAKYRIDQYCSVLASMARNPFPDDFLAMRNFLIRVTIDGTEYEGPNATYIPGWNRFDVALGTCPNFRESVLPERMAKMPKYHARKTRAEVRWPSLSDVVFRTLGVEQSSQISENADELALLATKAPSQIQRAVSAASDLARAYARMVGIHWGVIQQNLVKPAKLNDAAATLTTHSAGEGVSGRDLSVTDGLRMARLQHPLCRLRLGMS